LEVFMDDVSQVLQHSSTHPTAGKRQGEDNLNTDDGESQNMESSNESDGFTIYSTAKRRKLDFARRERLSVSSDDDTVSIEDNDEFHDDIPSFFHPSM